jgi:glutathione S-transferase
MAGATAIILNPMQLYWRPGTAAFAADAALVEIDVPYERILVERDSEGNVPEDYLRINPMGQVPTLVDDSLVLSEVAAILLYLADRYPEARLAPASRAHFYRWLIFLTNTLQPALMRHFYPERFGTEGVRSAADGQLRRVYDVIESELNGRRWLVGEERSAADLLLFMLTEWGSELEPSAWARPNLRAHFERTLELASVRQAVAVHRMDLP